MAQNFREMRRKSRAVSEERCREILRTAKRGVLAVMGTEGYPYGIPMNFVWNDAENIIYFHGGRTGHKIEALQKSDRVSFTVWEEENPGDWDPYVTSVILFGRAELVADREETVRRVRELGLKYYPSAEEVEKEIAASIGGVQLIALHMEHMTGKRVQEK